MHPLVLAEYICIILPVACFLSFNRRAGAWMRILAIFVMLAGPVVLYATGSRAAYLVLGSQLLLYLLNRALFDTSRTAAPIRVFFSISVIAMAAIAAPLSVGFVERLIGGTDVSESTSTSARLDQLDDGLRAMSIRPLLGWGPGTVIDHAATSTIATGERSVDNYYLNLGVESGVPAVLLFLGMAAVFISLCFRLRRTAPQEFGRFALAVFFSIVAFLIYAVILSTYEAFPFMFVIFGMLCSLNALSAQEVNRLRRPVNRFSMAMQPLA